MKKITIKISTASKGDPIRNDDLSFKDFINGVKETTREISVESDEDLPSGFELSVDDYSDGFKILIP